MAIVDPETIKESNHTEEEYKKLVEDAVSESDENIEVSGWYTIGLPVDASGTITRELRDIPTSFSGQVQQDPVKETHPSINSITVTVGRKPGKIVDDEIRE
jgi:hypothetical protein